MIHEATSTNSEKNKERVRYEPPMAVKRWPQVTTPAESLDSVQGWSSRRTPRAELHDNETRAVCGATDRTGAEWLAELMSIA